MMVKRKSISKKKRFEILKRDGFSCQYCGAHPPQVILQVDHITPIKKGGDNSEDNLITSCQPCNIGKGVVSLIDIPTSLKDKAKAIEESELQIKGYNEIAMAKKYRIDDEAWRIAASLENVQMVEKYNSLKLQSIKLFLNRLDFASVIDAAEKSFAKFQFSENKTFRYFCGICWKRIKGNDNG